ncbi:hypothetical protein WMW72_19290 [Paenibacillus filicis]|uniref:Uncharacterized protein n=1 Tax=Paenibacillus filicis TaxID=669464 RepID=A0ABU9DMF8_9BACL
MNSTDGIENEDSLILDQDFTITADKDNVNKHSEFHRETTSAETCRAGLDE